MSLSHRIVGVFLLAYAAVLQWSNSESASALRDGRQDVKPILSRID